MDGSDRPIAVVTGGARGIGSAISHRLAGDGCHVVVADINGTEAEMTANGIIAADGSAQHQAIDLRDRDQINALMQRLTRVDIVVNNAGIVTEKSLSELTENDFRSINEINLIGAFSMAQAAAARMKSGGRIINISSRAFLGAPNQAHYVASKAALVGLTRALAIELATAGITVNSVAPGLIETAMLENLSPELRQLLLSQQPTGKAGTPDDVANAVSFFASPLSQFVTGQILFVDGGKSLGQGMGK